MPHQSQPGGKKVLNFFSHFCFPFFCWFLNGKDTKGSPDKNWSIFLFTLKFYIDVLCLKKWSFILTQWQNFSNIFNIVVKLKTVKIITIIGTRPSLKSAKVASLCFWSRSLCMAAALNPTLFNIFVTKSQVFFLATKIRTKSLEDLTLDLNKFINSSSLWSSDCSKIRCCLICSFAVRPESPPWPNWMWIGLFEKSEANCLTWKRRKHKHYQMALHFFQFNFKTILRQKSLKVR